MQKEEVIDAVRDWFDEEGYQHEYNAEREFLRSGFTLQCKLRNVRIFINFHDNGYNVLAVSPVQGDPKNLEELMRYLHMANYGLKSGNFELDVRDGEVRYKCWVETDGLESLPSGIIESSVVIPCSMFDRYGDGIAALCMGFSDADTEIRKVEGGDDEDEDGGEGEG